MTAMWIAGYVYTACLALIFFAVWRRGPRPMMRTTMAIVGWFAAANAWTIPAGGGEPWALFFALDVIAAMVVLVMPAGKMQSLIGTTFLIKLAFDTAYGIAYFKGVADPVKYWWALTLVGFVQLLLVGGWWLSEHYPSLAGIRHIVRFNRSPNSAGVG